MQPPTEQCEFDNHCRQGQSCDTQSCQCVVGGFCGDSILQAGEDCEQGVACQNGGICSLTDCSCSTSLACGDGVIQSPEECDDGPNNSDIVPGACRTNCAAPVCGDFVIDFVIGGQQEECDLGSGNSDSQPDTCRNNCLLPRCGDSVVDTGEQCDDGNTFDRDGCNDTCEFEENFTARCGNGRLELGEECDDNNNSSGDGCNSNCRLEGDNTGPGGRCGDGIATVGEECDDGNTNSGDGCNSACRVEVTSVAGINICGDGLIGSNEECDDGNRRDFDGCTATCELEIGFCGDGVVQNLLGEQCEPTSHASNLSYSCDPLTCRHVSQYCGDGFVDPGEQCDDGFNNSQDSNANCRTDCSFATCGDGVWDTDTELCEDGNRRGGDGCDRFCRPEVPSAPTQVAGQFTQQQLAFAQQQNPNQVAGAAGQLGGQVGGQFLPFPYQNIAGQGQPGQLNPLGQQIGVGGTQFPTTANLQPLPYQLPYASVLPLATQRAPVGDTGPAALAVMAAGAAAGMGWTRKKRRK